MELKCFMIFFHFCFNPLIPHSTRVLSLAYIFFYACTRIKSCLGASSHLTSRHITNMSSPIQRGLPNSKSQSNHLYPQEIDSKFYTSWIHIWCLHHGRSQDTHYQKNDWSMVANCHFFVHTIDLLMPIGPKSINIITSGYANLNESPINEPNKP